MAFSGPIPGQLILGHGEFDNPPPGYVIEEFFLDSDAKRYDHAGTMPFKTRFVVVRPANPAAFNGTVLVEWLNVSAGTDGAPEWAYLHREIVRSGYAYVGVSAQKVGLDGSLIGIPGVLPVKSADPARYATLSHPGDAYAFDIFNQCSRAIIQGAILGGLSVRQVIAMGESQSAIFLTTYVNEVDPLERIFDGFLIHSRFRGAVPLDGDYVLSIQSHKANDEKMPVPIRADARVPVLMFITETDLLLPAIGYLPARQDDTRLIRTWEVAGTAHADSYVMLGASIDTGRASIKDLAHTFAPIATLFGQALAEPINAAPQHHYVLQAALAELASWVRTSVPPASQPRLKAHDGRLATDDCGNAHLGVRSPWMDVPTAKFSGFGQSAGGFAVLFGSTKAFDAQTLSRLYPGGRREYLEKFAAALAASVAGRRILAADQDEIMALAGVMWPEPRSNN